jgi:serine/threonine-protein kinase
MTVAPVDSRVGSELAGYRIESLIARGGMAAVYLAEHLRLRRKVALKLLAPELAADERFQERFLRESQLAASLDHPNVVPIYDADEAEGVLYIAMRYVEGSDLRDLLRRDGALEPARALRLVAQAAAGLDAAHRRGLVHRDVKPGNILLGEDEHVYVSDFGLTKQASSQTGLTATGQLVGTVDYVAPEQIRGESVDARADVYSLACVLYECLAGAKPFEKDTEVAIIWAHMQDPPPAVSEKRPELPRGLDDVLAKGMAKEPSQRPLTCRELVEAARQELGLSSGEIPSPVPPRRRAGRRWLAVGLLAGALIVAAAIAGVLLFGSDGEDEAQAVPLARANSVAVIDAKTNTLVGSTPVGNTPTDVVAGAGSIWVANRSDQTVSRIDPATQRLRETIGVGITPRGLAVGSGALWTSDRDVVVRHELRFDDSRTIMLKGENPAPSILGQGPYLAAPMAFGDGAAWVAHGFAVERVGAATGSTREIWSELGGGPSGVALTPEAIWIADSTTGSVVRIDVGSGLARTVGVTRRGAGVPGGVGGIAAGAAALWATSTTDDELIRIDPETVTVTRRVRVGDRPNGVTYGAGAVWVANTDGTVSRTDPSGRRITKIRVGGSPTGIAYARGRVWVSVQKG